MTTKTTKTATKSTAKTATKETASRSRAAQKPAFDISVVAAGFRAGDVYQALATVESPLSLSEIAKATKLSTEEVCIGIGWLLKEGKVAAEGTNVTLA